MMLFWLEMVRIHTRSVLSDSALVADGDALGLGCFSGASWEAVLLRFLESASVRSLSSSH